MRGFSGLQALVLVASAAFCAPAAVAADVTITEAKIAGGKLVVTGTTTTGNMNLTLDEQFNAKSNASKAFTFSVVYLPPDCIVSVGKAGATTATQAVVANCAARGLNAQGTWNAAAEYLVNDVVTHLGSAWRALKNNKNKSPSAIASAPIWEKFVSKGDPGAAGPAGPAGPAGAAGAVGAPGAAGPAGPAGPAGASGAQGPKGIAWKGAWSVSGGYGVDDAVQHAGRAYIALLASTGDDPKNPASESSYWSLLAAGPNWRGEWDGGTDYALNDSVTRNGSSYVAIQTNTNQDPNTQSAYWSSVAKKGDKGDTGDVGPQGAQGETGPQGATGAQGPQGPQGPEGPQGPKGNNGANGFNGADGLQGPPGPQGPSGVGSLQEYAHIYNTSAQFVSVGSAVTFDKNGPLSSGITHNPGSSFTFVNVAGLYLITYHAVTTTCALDTPSPNCVWTLYVNGVGVPGGRVSVANTQFSQASVLVQLNAGDVVQLKNTASTTSLNLPAGVATTYTPPSGAPYSVAGANASMTILRIK